MTGILLFLVATGCGGTSSSATQGGSALPDRARILDQHLDTAHLIITLHPTASGVDDPGTGLRSVDLHAEESLREPHGRWPDGSPVSADELVPPAQMRPLFDLLADRQFFERAFRRHSERVQTPVSPPPEGSTLGIPPRPMEPHVQIELHVHDAEYYHYFIATHPLGEAGRTEVQAIATGLSGRAAELVSSLASQL